MNYQQLDSAESRHRGPGSTMVLGYLALSLCVGVSLWGTIFSVSLIKGGLEPVEVASLALGFERSGDDPLTVAQGFDPFLVEPAAGPAKGCE